MSLEHVIWPTPGKYILAVSGGADSMVLLDLMADAAAERGFELVVAHFDHGLRPDSRDDRLFVQGAAKRYNLPFEHVEAKMGQGSEASARDARHSWLEQERREQQAAAVITAHHQDDLLETSLLNLARGSGRRGLAPMQKGRIIRPLIGLSRAALREYAAARKLAWREDPTNADLANPRNFLRHKLLPRADAAWRSRYLELIAKMASLNKKVAQDLDQILGPLSAPTGRAETPKTNRPTAAQTRAYRFPRELIQALSLPELTELILAAANSLAPGIELDRRLIDEIALFAKTGRPHRRRALRRTLEVHIEPNCVRITPYKPT